MPRTFFEKQSPSSLRKDIIALNQLFKTKKFLEQQSIEDLIEYKELINSYIQDPYFSNLRPAIKQILRRIIAQIDERMHLLNSVQDDIEEFDLSECYIQIPSPDEIAQMHHMPAGGKEDQQARIMHMTQALKNYHSLPIMTNTQGSVPERWSQLFGEITKGNRPAAFHLLDQIPETDIILQSLLAIHPRDYLKQLIDYSIQASKRGVKEINSDIVITPETFRVLITDLATTLLNPSKIIFSFGLPTHHAFSNEGSGFCLINKTAVLMKFWETVHEEPVHYVIIGTDVNRDNGLCQILCQTASHMNICHIDIFDSRVYPGQDHSYINQEFNSMGTEVGEKIKCWNHNNLEYYAVDLSLTSRKKIDLHPALQFALTKLKEQIAQAKTHHHKVALLLPTGWDSHEDETAPCGKWVNDRMMSQSEASKTRFNDGDLTFFYEQIFELYNENKEHITGIYWGLEGGYDRAMYERQINILAQLIGTHLIQQNSQASSSRMSY
ncbi:acetylpolyamine aminohydrolase [Legionella bononiensis]|uniref:Acetylpolyamine aminohydrolase n=1 Tax=Legionella bononiensis TaxID=2793102 RepID=A0ABS1W7H4_9GAMM|nr:acetylpolyamine aminohydrolase [Legionella bononiensis]MBL7481260.1 acetylpolyamine aminohydrolase [Legionella bononiensis]MBL7525165.1 acetylpolyamine aminohydrolase [Legionella bononiensis]MBL7562889.1 acetylpolyamine aminohydrolase [Legionella bononiensis]